MKNRLNSVYWKVREIPFISELFEKKRHAKSWDLMGTPVMSADKGGGVHSYAQLCIESAY
jgi:hypothetical protein